MGVADIRWIARHHANDPDADEFIRYLSDNCTYQLSDFRSTPWPWPIPPRDEWVGALLQIEGKLNDAIRAFLNNGSRVARNGR